MAIFDDIAKFYDLEHDEFREDIDFYRNFAVSAGGAVLELACGTGRITIPLAEAGFRVTGIDNSAAMLDIARSKLAAELRDKVDLVRANMQDFSLPGKFGLAIVALNGFMHAESLEAQAHTLQCIARHLGLGGTLIVDLDNPLDSGIEEQEGRLLLHWMRSDPVTGHSISKLFSSTVDGARQTRLITLFYDEVDGTGRVTRTVASFNLRYLFRYEMELLLEKCGFTLKHVYGSYNLDDFTTFSERMIFVASRKE